MLILCEEFMILCILKIDLSDFSLSMKRLPYSGWFVLALQAAMPCQIAGFSLN